MDNKTIDFIKDLLKEIEIIIVSEEKYEHLIETQLKFTMLLDKIFSGAHLTSDRNGLEFNSDDVAQAIIDVMPQLYDIYYSMLLEDRTGLN